MDRPAPSRCARRPGARRRPPPDAEIDGGEFSWRSRSLTCGRRANCAGSMPAALIIGPTVTARSNRQQGSAQIFRPLHLDEHAEALLLRIALLLRFDQPLPDLLVDRAGLADFRGSVKARDATPR